jgi:hypothetical protein
MTLITLGDSTDMLIASAHPEAFSVLDKKYIQITQQDAHCHQ